MSLDRLIEQIAEKQNPTVVGLDPFLPRLPAFLLRDAYRAHGRTLEGAAAAVLAFNRAIIDAVCDVAPAVKPQLACYEQLGWPGLRALSETVRYAHQKGLFVILDGKRNDIGSTMAAYAAGWIGTVALPDPDAEPGAAQLSGAAGDSAKSAETARGAAPGRAAPNPRKDGGPAEFAPFDGDALTVNGYLGTDGVSPLLEPCRLRDRGLFVLVKTSNPSSGELQNRPLADGRPLYRAVGELCERWGESCPGRHGYSGVGAVVGATYPAELAELRRALPHTFFLVPGYGAQGGGADGAAKAFDQNGGGAVVNSSRAILYAYQKEGCPPEQFAAAARREALRMRDALRTALHNA